MIFCGHREPHAWWFRIFGYGIRYVDHRVYCPMFSEREGYKRFFHVGAWCFGLLKPNSITAAMSRKRDYYIGSTRD
jgi:hypothetical protein